MKVRITNMKAPWPEGAKLGDIVAFDGPAPAWAAGKHQPAPDSASADHVYEPPAVITGNGTGQALPSIEAVNAEIEDLRAQLSVANEAAEVARQAIDTERKRGDELAEKLLAAEAARDAAIQDAETLRAQLTPEGGADRAALEAEATALGVQFRSNISDETLAARIAEAKAAK